MMFYIKKYNADGKKIEKIQFEDILEAFSAMSSVNHSDEVKKAKMVDDTGNVFSRYYEFE